MAPGYLRKGVNTFPFSAIVGNGRAKGALVCALSFPEKVSMLICGPRGSGKSVLARSIPCICDDRDLVEIPLNATEDQIFGGMDIEDTIRDGRKRPSRSILSRSHGNILLMENINLFPQHIVHQILNVVETGTDVVEREGISEERECSTVFIATMDAEEGGISEHILDRFDICVFMECIEDEELRTAIVERRLAFESDPRSFIVGYSSMDSGIAESIRNARSKSRFTRVPEGYCNAISDVCNSLNVAGHRGDISMMNTSCVLAALDGRDSANLDDLKEAAAICLEHRRNDAVDEVPPQEPPHEPPPEPQSDDDPSDGSPDDGSKGEHEQSEPPETREETPEELRLPPPPDSTGAEEEVFSIGDTYRVIDYMSGERRPSHAERGGRHKGAVARDRTGRCVGYRLPNGRVEDVALVPSIRIAAPYQAVRDHSRLALVLERNDLREKVREKRQGRDILFMVDGSGSIGAQKRMVAVKGAILSMLKDAYQKRDSIGMAVFRMDRAEEVLPLTRSILKAYHVLAEIPTGGRTPITHALIKGHEILKGCESRDSRPVMVILTDGRSNVSFTRGVKPVDEMLGTARALAESGIRFIVIDTETGRPRFGLALELCRALDGTYLKLEDLNAEHIERSVRSVIDQ